MAGGDSGLDEVMACATLVARERFGAAVGVREAEVIAARGRSLVVRCRLRPHPDAPPSLIVKRYTDDDARAFSDWAGVAFLSSLPGAEGIAPVCYGGDAAARLLVLEDLGEWHTLGDLLAAGDNEAIEGALRALAVPMARLVASTADAETEGRYKSLRLALPGGAGLGRRQEAARWREALPRATAWFAALGCLVGAAFEAAWSRVADAYAEPGAFLAYSHGDPAPSNNAIGPTTARLLDFEYGAYRHALYDITGWVFSIWGLIYLSLVAFVIYSLLPAGRHNPRVQRLGPPFVITCVANSVWLFLWHWEQFPLSTVAMATLLLALIVCYSIAWSRNPPATIAERICLRFPFSLYLGWVSVATIANVTVTLDRAGWGGGGLAPEAWAALMVLVGGVLAALIGLTRSDPVYPAVFVWAFVGLAVRQRETELIAFTAAAVALAAAVIALIALLRPLARAGGRLRANRALG